LHSSEEKHETYKPELMPYCCAVQGVSKGDWVTVWFLGKLRIIISSQEVGCICRKYSQLEVDFVTFGSVDEGRVIFVTALANSDVMLPCIGSRESSQNGSDGE
jgi:hypothetical protein